MLCRGMSCRVVSCRAVSFACCVISFLPEGGSGSAIRELRLVPHQHAVVVALRELHRRGGAVHRGGRPDGYVREGHLVDNTFTLKLNCGCDSR